jgi:hypothetical protein
VPPFAHALDSKLAQLQYASGHYDGQENPNALTSLKQVTLPTERVVIIVIVVAFIIIIIIILPAVESTQSLTEMSTRNLLGGGRPVGA